MDGRIVVEIKAVEALAPIHESVMLTYLRLSGCQVGLLINFHVPMLKDGIRRLVWKYQPPEQDKDNAGTRRTQRIAEKAPEQNKGNPENQTTRRVAEDG